MHAPTSRFTNAIRPACLWQTLELPAKKAFALGWGALSTNGETNDALMKVELDIKENDECSRKFANDDSLASGVTSDFICAGSGKFRDTCHGGKFFVKLQIFLYFFLEATKLFFINFHTDSGGPLQVVKPGANCQFHIIGLTSFAPPLCASKAAVAGYTRVSHYLDWIEDKVWR